MLWLNSAIVFLTVSLMQFHSIPLWLSLTGYIGVLWSLLLEGVSLWYWYHKHYILGVLTSLIVVASALYNITGSIQDELRLMHKLDKQIVLLSNKLKQDKKSLDSLLETNWAKYMKQGIEEHKKTSLSLEKATLERVALGNYEEKLYLVFVQLFALFLIVIAQIKATIMLSRNKTETSTTVVPKKLETIQETPVEHTGLAMEAKVLLNDLYAFMEQHGLNENQCSQRINVNRATFSKLKNTISGEGVGAGANMIKNAKEKLKKEISNDI